RELTLFLEDLNERRNGARHFARIDSMELKWLATVGLAGSPPMLPEALRASYRFVRETENLQRVAWTWCEVNGGALLQLAGNPYTIIRIPPGISGRSRARVVDPVDPRLLLEPSRPDVYPVSQPH
ncbi:MAG TPA: hypothetical protein VFJ82_20975, partial [Longimicrobium sp.]|nr:hypothetical protein [Longimicrobium sp.]